jgi:hypothetical protein
MPDVHFFSRKNLWLTRRNTILLPLHQNLPKVLVTKDKYTQFFDTLGRQKKRGGGDIPKQNPPDAILDFKSEEQRRVVGRKILPVL